jgi:hypothetical protein
MARSQFPKIYAGMLKQELLDVAERLGLRGVKKLRKEELIERIQTVLKRPKSRASEPPEAAGGPRVVATTRPEIPPRSPDERPGPGLTRHARGDLEPRVAARTSDATASTVARADAAGTGHEPAPGASGDAAPPPRPAFNGSMSEQSRVTAAKYRVGTPFPEEELRQVDTHLPGLPDGYGEDRLVLLPRDPHWLYAYWDLKNETKDSARSKGGKNLSLRLFELRDGELEPMAEHWCQELTRSWYVQVPSPGQTYVAEIGYRAIDGSWLRLLGSNAVKVPPAAPSAVVSDQFVTLRPDRPLPRPQRRKAAPAAVSEDTSPGAATLPVEAPLPRAEVKPEAQAEPQIRHERAFEASGGQRPEAGAGSASAVPDASGSPYTARAWSASAGFAGRAPVDDKGFWLMADAELVVFGATDPGASVRVGRQTVRVRSDGTFSARMTFPDGDITVPIEATSPDGTERRDLKVRFRRHTTNGGTSE